MFAVYGRELSSYFRSLIGFIFMGFFLLITAIFFITDNLLAQSASYTTVLGNITFIFLITVPILTMRLLSEEKNKKTDQLILTSPVTLTGIVVGKFAAAVTIFLITLIITFLFPLQLSMAGTVAAAHIAGGYIGFFFLGCCFIAVGLFVSSLTDNQVIAAVATFGLLLVMWIIEFLHKGLPADRVSGFIFALMLIAGAGLFIFFTVRNIFLTFVVSGAGIVFVLLTYVVTPVSYDGLILKILRWFSLLDRYREFSLGLLKLSSIIYYISFSFVFLFLTIRVLDGRRWK